MRAKNGPKYVEDGLPSAFFFGPKVGIENTQIFCMVFAFFFDVFDPVSDPVPDSGFL